MPHTATAAPTNAAGESAAPPRTLRAWRTARREARRANPGPITLPTLEARHTDVTTSAGQIHVREVGPAEAPVLLFAHGLLVDGHMWDLVAAELSADFRCVLPDLPLGSHATPLDPASDRTPSGQARLIGELAAWTGAADVTIVAADSGCALTQLLMDQGAAGVTRVVLATGDCFDHFFPPGFRLYQRLAWVPLGLRVMVATARLRFVRNGPIAYGLLTHRPVDDGVQRAWLTPLRTTKGILADLRAFLRGVSAKELIAAEERLGRFDRPVLLAWAPEQRWFPIEHAHRLAEILPQAEIAEIEASGAFPALDQPAVLAGHIRRFAA